MPITHCWDQSQGHHGPCCMACIIAEANRRAGADVPFEGHETRIVDEDGQLLAVVRSCCWHAVTWEADAVAETIVAIVS